MTAKMNRQEILELRRQVLDEIVYVSVYPLFSSVSVPTNSVSCLVKLV